MRVSDGLTGGIRWVFPELWSRVRDPVGLDVREGGRPDRIVSSPGHASLGDARPRRRWTMRWRGDAEVDRLWDEFHRAVNMTSRELREWPQSWCLAASLPSKTRAKSNLTLPRH